MKATLKNVLAIAEFGISSYAHHALIILQLRVLAYWFVRFPGYFNFRDQRG